MYEQFLHQAGKSELLSFFRRYENSMNKRKKYVSPKEFYDNETKEAQKQFDKAMKDIAKIKVPEPKFKDPMEYDMNFNQLKGGEEKK